MKIRTQLNVFILGIIVIPLASVIFLPIYHYINSPQRYLLKSYKQIRKINGQELSENDWSFLYELIHDVPPNVQILVKYKNQILISNIPEIKSGTEMDVLELFDFMENTSDIYDYQMQAPIIRRRSAKKIDAPDSKMKFWVISRSKIPSEDKNPNHFYLGSFAFISVFEIFCIYMVIRLSRTIYSSITLLEESTQKIANGELDTKIEQPKGKDKTNEITSLAESLEKMRISLKDDQERRSKFIMGISHDLRTPVALIKGYTEAITDGVITDIDAIKNSLGIIHTKADQLENMINDLINYMKLNNADWRQTLEFVFIEPFLLDFANSAKATAGVYNRTIITNININPQTKVPMDKNLFSRALENIFSNALRYTKDNDRIEINAIEENNCVKITISDSGIGIAEKDLEHIYDIFYRGTNSRRESGMGIGLSVVKTIIDTHGWNIDVKSKQNEGSSFIISIPLSAEESQE